MPIYGREIHAENIQLHARKLLEIRAAKNTESRDFRQNGGSVSVHLDGSFAGASAHESKYHSETVQYQNTCLKARNLISILNEGKTIIQGGALEARDVMIKTAELLLESLQDTHNASGHSNSVCIDPDGNGGIQAGRESAHKAWVNHSSFIKAERNLNLFVDYLTQKGSVLSAEQKLRVQGLHQENPLNWCHEDLQEVDSSHAAEIGGNFNGNNDSFPFTGFGKFKNAKKTGVTRATVSAPEVVGNIPVGMNRDVSKTQEVLSDKKSSIGVPIVVPNPEKLREDAEIIKNAFQQPKKAAPTPLEPVQEPVPKEKTQKEANAQEVDAIQAASEKIMMEELIFQQAKLHMPDADEQILRQLIGEQLKQYPTPKERLEFINSLPGEFNLFARQYIASQNQDEFQKVALPMVGAAAYQAALFITALAYMGVDRYQDWKKRNPGFSGEQDYESEREKGTYVFPEHVWKDNTTGYEPGGVHGLDLGNDTPGFMPIFSNKINLIYKNKHKSKGNDDRPNMPDPNHQYHPAPKGALPGFPEAKQTKGMTPDGTGRTRARWRLPSGEILEWDKQHGELEMYDKNGKNHLGAFDPNTSTQLKAGKPDRNIKKFVN